MVRRVVNTALASRATEVIVVVGHEAELVTEALREMPVKVVVNVDYDRGMSTSLQAGLRAVTLGCQAAVFLLADQPFMRRTVVDLLIDRFVDTEAWIVRPAVGGIPTHPVLMSAQLFPEIMSESGDVGGREIGRRHAERQLLVALEDSQIAVDVDTDQDYRTALLEETGGRFVHEGPGGS